jgi:hypothetical protein
VQNNVVKQTPGKSVSLTRTYAPVGRCIYCGASEWSTVQSRRLGDEHIVPEGLGGRLLLPEASCEKCEKETSKFELEWLRSAFHTARVQKGLGKKKKRPPRFLPLQVQRNGKTVWESIPLEKYPAMIVTLLFDQPEILSDCSPVEKMLSGGVAIGILPTFGRLLKPYLDRGVVTFAPPRSSATSEHLGRMLAKIAHSYAVAELGIEGFTPFLTNIILGVETRYLSHFIGGTREIPSASSDVYEVNLSTIERTGHRPLFMVAIRLLSDVQGMPEYRVVVGQHRGGANFQESDLVNRTDAIETNL